MGNAVSDETRGIVFNCESFSLHNGPGIRTTLFLKGCPLRCLWCANPESWSMEAEVSYNRELCIPECRECEKIAGSLLSERDREGKILIPPGIPRTDATLAEAAGACPARALSVEGCSVSVEDAVQLLCKDRPFFDESGGGVTLSGGEPLLQPEFSAALLRRLKSEGIHTALDTCGDAAPEIYRKVSKLADLVLFDFKAAGSDVHREWTGKSNERILANLEHTAAERPQQLRVRIPFIPGLNGTENEMSAMAKVLKALGISRADLLPYHRLGIHKYRQQGKEYTLGSVTVPVSETLQEAVQIFRGLGVELCIQ